MDEESAKTRETTVNQQQQYYYGTFQGVANYPPPAPPPQLLPLPRQPIATSPLIPPVHGYQNLPGFIYHFAGVWLITIWSLAYLLFCDCFLFEIDIGHGGGGGAFVNYAQGYPLVPRILLHILFLTFLFIFEFWMKHYTLLCIILLYYDQIMRVGFVTFLNLILVTVR